LSSDSLTALLQAEAADAARRKRGRAAAGAGPAAAAAVNSCQKNSDKFTAKTPRTPRKWFIIYFFGFMGRKTFSFLANKKARTVT
jgi:hypothetical protein